MAVALEDVCLMYHCAVVVALVIIMPVTLWKYQLASDVDRVPLLVVDIDP